MAPISRADGHDGCVRVRLFLPAPSPSYIPLHVVAWLGTTMSRLVPIICAAQPEGAEGYSCVSRVVAREGLADALFFSSEVDSMRD